MHSASEKSILNRNREPSKAQLSEIVYALLRHVLDYEVHGFLEVLW